LLRFARNDDSSNQELAVMQELTRPQFALTRTLFRDIPYLRSVVFSNLDGPQYGRVFVERIPDPAAAMIWSDAVYFAGSPANTNFNQALKRFVVEEVFPQKEHLLFYPFDTLRDTVLMDLFQEYGITHITRTGFHFDPAIFQERHHGWRAHIPAGYTVLSVDGAVGRDNPNTHQGITDLWGKLEIFLEHGVGYVVMHEGQVVSSCLSVFVGDGHAEMGLNTDEAFRCGGLATLAACAFIEECLQRGLVPDWQCFYNPPSEHLALKLGFVDKTEMRIPYLHVLESFFKP
jgi:hypothetical protein